MFKNTTHPDGGAIVTTYALGQGGVTCGECAAGYPTIIQAFTSSQDKIDWDIFLMGMILTQLFSIQELHLQVSGSLRSPTKWAIGCITQLLQITHAQ
jgi:hypothetical protein